MRIFEYVLDRWADRRDSRLRPHRLAWTVDDDDGAGLS